MDEEGRKFSRDSVSRRSVLKGMGAGAAIAWSAPVLQSLAAPAHAQYGCGPTCADIFCGGDATNCGASGPFQQCLCSQDTEGACFCAEDAICTGTNDCASSAECGPGQRCMRVCCSGLNQCLDPCGTNPGARRAKSNAKRASQA